MSSVTQQVVAFVDDLSLRHVPDSVVEKGKLHILDGLGVALACSEVERSKRISRALRKLGGGKGSTVWAYGFRSTLSVATMINGTLIEALDYSDIHVNAGLHPTCVVVPALITLAETARASGTDVLEAYLAGCEVMIRLGEAASGKYHERGIQPTSAIGVFASALAVGKLLKLTRKQLTHALSLASILAFGSSLSVRVGSYFGGIDPGRASESGLVAAFQAREGVEGIAEDALEGRFGFLEMYAGKGNYDLERLTKGLGHSWEFAETFLKRYPTSYAHTYCLDAALKLRRLDRQFAISDIKGVTFGETPQNIALFAEPQSIKRSPKTIYDAKTSHYFLLAAALVEGNVGVGTISEKRIREKRILELADRISYAVDEKSHWVEVTLRDGTSLKAVQNTLVPTPRDAAVGKFLSNATTVLDRAHAEALMEQVLSMERLKDVKTLIPNLVA
jgi:2-methylcitrate dehydratase PrpD